MVSKGKNLQHGSISHVSELLPPVCFRAFLMGEVREGQLCGLRDGADAGED
jgi:hypothetical protein